MNNHTIHGHEDGLVDWPYKSPLTERKDFSRAEKQEDSEHRKCSASATVLVFQRQRPDMGGYGPNATVEISSADITPILLPSRRASFCSVYNSGEDVTMTTASSEVDERQSIGRLASLLPMQKREARV